MKTNATSTELLMIAPLLIAILYVTTIWSQMPGQIPVHYDAAGTVNGWSSKTALALEGIGMTLVMYLLLRFLPRIDSRGRLESPNYQKIRLLIMLFLPLPQLYIFYLAAHPASGKEPVGPILALIGLLIAGLGNYMTTIKPNWFVGIRTPWTLDSEAVWRKTHLMGGRLMFGGGLLAAVVALVVPLPYTVGVFLGIISIVATIPVVYSYICFRQEKAHRLN